VVSGNTDGSVGLAACVLLLHTESHQSSVEKASLHEAIVPLVVEEVSAFAADYWLAMLAGQACRIVLVSDAPVDDPNRAALQMQMDMVHELLAGLGIDEQAVCMVSSSNLATGDLACLQANSFLDSRLNTNTPAEFSTHNDKRQTLRLALDSLAEAFAPLTDSVALPAGAPFGYVEVHGVCINLSGQGAVGWSEHTGFTFY
jgi:hypothetical protein